MRWDDEFEAFVRTHTDDLYRAAFVLCGDSHRAADLVQETLTALYPRWSKVMSADVPAAYVRRALINQFLTETRRLKGNEHLIAEIPERPSWLDHAQAIDRVVLAGPMAALVAKQRIAVTLSYLYDLGDHDAAHVMGCSKAAFRGHLRRGLATLRGALCTEPPAASTDTVWSES